MLRASLLAVALAAAAAVFYAASPVPRITPDSATYLTGAETIAEGAGFEDCKGAVTLFAPGYSAAMAPLIALGVDAPDAARVVNAIATFFLVLGAAFLGARAGLSPRLVVLVGAGVAVAYATLRNGALAWSEPLFCALLAWLLALALGLEARLTWRLVGVVALTWSLLLTRHSGAFVLPAVLVAAWLGSSALRHRLARVTGLALVLLAVPSLWWLRNIEIDGDPFGRRSGSRFSALDVLDQLPDGLSSIALPRAAPLELRLVVLVPLVVAAALAWRARGSRPAVLVLVTAVVVYVAAVTVAAMRTVVDPLDTRLLSPILAPGAVLVALGVGSPRAALQRALAAYALVLVVATAVLAPGVVWRSHDEERSLAGIPDDVSCAGWPALYRP